MLQKLKKKLKDQKGLTLIELLAVIVIIGIIAAIAIPSIGKVIDNSRVEAVKADATQLLNVAKLYVAEEGMPAGGTISVTTESATRVLDSYFEGVTTFKEGYTIKISDKNVYTLTGNGKKNGVTVEFYDASISTINDAKKGSKEIGTKPASGGTGTTTP